jgi:hypothetical protein
MVRSTAGVLVLLASASWALADQRKANHKAEIDALRAQIKALQAEEKATLKAIKAQYESILQRDKLSKTQLEEEKVALRAQEKALLELATNKDEKHAIREQYQLLFKILNGEIKLDRELIAKIKLQEKDHLALIRTLYKAKIQSLRSLIQSLEQKKGH